MAPPSRTTGGGFALASLPSSIRDTVRGLDKDGSGFIEEDEFVAAVEQMVQQRRDSRLLKQVLAAVVVLNLLLTAAVVGCVWSLVVAHKDTESTGGALVYMATGAPLRTAAGFVAVTPSVEADADVLALWAGPDGAAAPSRYAPAEGSTLVYANSVNASAVALACELIAEGRDRMVVSIGAKGSAPLTIIHAAACPTGGAAAEGLVEYNGRELLARCPEDVSAADAKCHLFREEAGNATVASAAGTRRRLLSAGAAGTSTHVVAGASELRCDAGGECQITEGVSGRRSL